MALMRRIDESASSTTLPELDVASEEESGDPRPRRHADEEDGIKAVMSPPEHLETRPGRDTKAAVPGYVWAIDLTIYIPWRGICLSVVKGSSDV